ncbi:ArnT family glycosyltransferase [Schlesneria paludicola]|uniref:ArnT family glycosyltransferase n=1 Tax=Schlesneria paludicola TaxID=360056 RepID=UPI000299EA72|nr:glycosyltransferase family 39 protein [Schlesneria paludicola]
MRRPDGSSKANTSNESPRQDQVSRLPASIPTVHVGLACVWLVGFFVWFQSFDLPNNHVDRWMLWEGMPYRMLDLFDPPSTPNAPWSWLYLGQRIPFFLIALITWIGAGALGSLLLRALSIRAKGSERLCFSIGLGLSFFSLSMMLLGLIGWMSRWPLLLILTSAVLAEIVCRRREFRVSSTPSLPQSSPPTAARNRKFGGIILAILMLFVLGQQLGAMTPQSDFDVLEYHLGGPKEWFQLGRIQRLPHNVYTSFPFLTEMLILSSMVLYGDWDWGALAGQSVIAGFIPLTAIGLYAAGRRWFSKATGQLAAVIYLTSPWMYRVSLIAYAEGGLSYYLFAAMFAALRYGFPDNEAERPKHAMDLNWVLLSGMLAGSAMACKYTGLVLVVIPLCILLAWMTARRLTQVSVPQIAVAVVVYGTGVACTIGPWLLKNTAETGNPVFPLATRIFGGADRDEALNLKWARGHDSPYPNWGVALRDLPVKLTDVVSKNDWHSPLLFCLAPLSLLYGRRRRPISDNESPQLHSQPNRTIIGIVWFYAGWQFANWWLFTHHIDRFYVPIFSGVSLLAGVGACWYEQPQRLDQKSPRVWTWIVWPVLIAGALYNIDIMQLVGGFNAGRTDLTSARDTAIAYTVPRQKWINEGYASGRLPADFKVLCVGEAALFHAHYPYLYNTVFDHSLFQQICADPHSPHEQLRPAAEILAELQRVGITHVEVSWTEILRYREPGSYGYTEFVHPDRFAELQRMGVLGQPVAVPLELTTAPLEKASSDRQKLIADWAPGLITIVAGETRYRTAQLFPVLRGPNSDTPAQLRD